MVRFTKSQAASKKFAETSLKAVFPTTHPTMAPTTAGKKSIKPAFTKTKPAKPKTASAKPNAPVKTKRLTIKPKKKKRTYTDKELNLPTLNAITPAGIVKPKGKKKGKIFVDDAESMRTILAMVSADREGQIESKMQKARQMEEIREARKAEMEAKEKSKKDKLEGIKDGLRRKRNKAGKENEERAMEAEDRESSKKSKKRVSFG